MDDGNSMTKKRLDVLVHEKYPHYSRSQIQRWIMRGKVFVDGEVITKAGSQVQEEDANIELRAQEPKYISRAGFKLEHALNQFRVNVKGLVVLDAGISTGGFTDCLLQHGAQKVYGVDVGYGQVAEKIRADDRVVILEGKNLRHLKESDIGENVDLVTLDLSFISVLKVMSAVTQILKKDGQLIVLVKPQFEASKHEVGRGGIITDPSLHKSIVKLVVDSIEAYGFMSKGVIESPVLGAAGNKEFLAYFERKINKLKGDYL